MEDLMLAFIRCEQVGCPNRRWTGFKEKQQGIDDMSTEIAKITPEIIERHVRRAHVERSIAISKAFRDATRSVKNIFTAPEAVGIVRGH
jgi:hypothetical protein